MFRLQENVPEVYVKESRDFQLFCRLYDVVNNASRFNVKSTSMLLSPEKCIDSMLPLLCTKVGFFPKSEYNVHALRLIIESFPYMMKYKGSKRGIEIAVHTILKAENNYSSVKVDVNDALGEIMIYTSKPITDELLLKDVLSYVIPIGYSIEIGYYTALPNMQDSQMDLDMNNTAFYTDVENVSKIINGNDLNTLWNGSNKEVIENATANYVVTEVISADDLSNN